MLEARGKRISEVSARLMESDAETLWAEIRELARNHDYPFAARILEVGEHEHWTVMHVALALAHAGASKILMFFSSACTSTYGKIGAGASRPADSLKCQPDGAVIRVTAPLFEYNSTLFSGCPSRIFVPQSVFRDRHRNTHQVAVETTVVASVIKVGSSA